jgi:ATP synthase F1 gamma subunit
MLGIRACFASSVAAPVFRSVITQRMPEAVVRGDRNASVKQLRLRLASVKSIQRITKTMKMVAAAKLKGFQTRMYEARPLGERVNYIVSQIPPANEEESAKDLKHLILPITSDRGLCGGVNGAVSKQVKTLFSTLPADSELFIIGNKGEGLLKRTHQVNIKRLVSDCYKNPTSFALASEIAEEVATAMKYDKATIVFNQFKSAIAYNTLAQEIESPELMTERLATFSEKYEFEDEFVESVWMQDMMHFCLASKIYACLLESATAEVSARMQAMENATKNCGEMIQKLTLQMNKARQAMITQELGEIVSGAAAVAESK